jgi:hypothetical protein
MKSEEEIQSIADKIYPIVPLETRGKTPEEILNDDELLENFRLTIQSAASNMAYVKGFKDGQKERMFGFLKRIFVVLTCLIFCGCSATYNVTTEKDFQNVRQNMLNTVSGYGYVLSDSCTYDTSDWSIVNRVYHPNYWGVEKYKFNKEGDSLDINLQYRHRCITEARTIPYIDSCKVKCVGDDIVCDSIQTIIGNLPKSEIKTITDGSLTGIIILIALLPFISVLSCAAIFNVR